MLFWILIPYSKFSRFAKTDLEDLSTRVSLYCLIFTIVRFQEIIDSNIDFLDCSNNSADPDSKMFVLRGAIDILTCSKNHGQADLLDVRKVKVKIDSSPMELNTSPFLYSSVKMDLQTPKSDLLQSFLAFSIGSQKGTYRNPESQHQKARCTNKI